MTIEQELTSVIRDIPDFPKEGIVFKDITPVLQNTDLVQKLVKEIAAQVKEWGVEVVAGIESRGFLLGIPLAIELGVPFVLIRKKGKLPYQTISQSYDLEYGSETIEMHVDAIKKGDRVLIHDDVLATGGTANAAAKLINQIGKVAGYSFIMDLSFLNGTEQIKGNSENISSLISY